MSKEEKCCGNCGWFIQHYEARLGNLMCATNRGHCSKPKKFGDRPYTRNGSGTDCPCHKEKS